MQGIKDSTNTAFSKNTDTYSTFGFSQDKYLSTIFVAFFIFLSLVLIIHSWHQWNEAEKHHQLNMTRSVDSFVAQASITSKASIHVNQLFADTHNNELVKLFADSNPEQQRLFRQKMENIFFNITGYMLIDSQGALLFQDGPALAENEIQLVQKSVNYRDFSSQFFAHHYGEQGGFYSISWFKHKHQQYGLIIRRSYNAFSQIIYNGGFEGYQLALYDESVNKIIIAEKHYYTDKNAIILDSIIDQVSYQKRIEASPWVLMAVENEYYLQDTLLSIVAPNLVILIIFIIVASILRLFLLVLTRKKNQESFNRRQIEQRADQSLMSIDEAIISTDCHKIITYCNPKAERILRMLSSQQIIGASLIKLWPDEQSLWSEEIDIQRLEALQEEQRELHLTTQDEELILEQSFNLLYDEEEVSGVVWLIRDVTEAVRNRRALEISRTRYKGIFDEAAIAHCILRFSNKDEGNPIVILDTNNAAIDLFHALDKQHFINDFPRLISEHVNDINNAIKSTLSKGKKTCDFKLNLNNFSYKSRIFWANISLHTGSDKSVLITFIDITEQENATKKLYAQERFWEKIMNQIVDMLYVLALDEKLMPRIEYCNSSINKLFGLPEPSSPLFSDWNLDFHTADADVLLQMIKKTRTLAPDESIIEKCRVKDSQGNWKIIRLTNSPFEYDNKGLVCRYISSVRDVTEEVEAQEELIENERRYRLLAENVNDVIWAVDIDLNFTFISSSIYSMLGYTPDEIFRGAINGIVNRSDLRKLNTRLLSSLKTAVHDSLEKNALIFKIDLSVTTKTGAIVIVELKANYLHDDQNVLEGIFGIVRNVTEERQVERELLLAGQVFENSNEAILVTNSKGIVIDANPAFSEVTQMSLNEIQWLRPDDLINKKFHGNNFYNEVGMAIIQDDYWQGEVHYLRKNGEERVSWTGISATKSPSGDVQNLILIFSDITERKVIERRIHKLAYFDPLTGLPNRSQMHERLEQMVTTARSNNTHISVLFLDLDRFKPINDSMGHPAGDAVLKEVAFRLKACIKDKDLVSRMSGDEFTIALTDRRNSDSAANTAVKVGERIIHALQQPFLIEQKELFLTGSIGIAIYPNDGHTVTELLKNSDMAMYHAKSQGRNSVQFFDEQMNKKAVDLLEMENDLRYAIERKEFELYYQPQFASSDGRIQGVEALLRWHHETKGMISPGLFIPIIEDTGLIIPIGEWVLRKACSDMAKWQQEGVAIERIAINVSARQFKQTGFIALVEEVINSTGIDPSQLELELTESLLIDDLEHTLEALSLLRKMGVRMAIDDFGTGYSSLNYLKRFPVDTLKIDQSFIRGLPESAEDGQITRTIISMAHNLGLGVIAEGVETQEQLEFLRQVECEEVQGFYFSKPLPEKELLAFTKSHKNEPLKIDGDNYSI